MKKITVSIGWLIFSALSAAAQSSAVFNPADGAIHGFDPVAYFKAGKPVKGNIKYSLSWNAATWYFSNQQNLDTFKASPEKFAPQYGGYCAFGLASGHKAPTDPQVWSIVDGKLYLNYSKDVQQSWKQQQSVYIKDANKNWPLLKNKE